MLNQKKLEIALKKYTKNFQKSSFYEDSKEQYEDIKSILSEIIDLNDTKRDHILLISIGTIFTYYNSVWKEDVFSLENKQIEGLKMMQISLFYQCIAQDLYKIRYPRMMVIYTFKEVVAALIHFTMYGWEKEETILFDFIVKHLGENSMSANDWNKHTWFLLELYLQYRKKTIFEIDQHVNISVKEKMKESEMKYALIPENLDIYSGVLKSWSTPIEEEITALIGQMINYHSELASELGKSIEFGDYRYGFYPYEILFLLHVRKKKGLPVPQHFEELLMNTPEAQMVFQEPEPYPEQDPLLVQIDRFYRKNYPDYFLNQYGEELFQ